MYHFKFADIGEGVHEGVLLKWEVKEGDVVKEGDTLCIVETDKVNAELPSPVNGKIAKIHFNVGDTVTVGDVIVTIDDGSGDQQDAPSSATEPISEEEDSAGVVGAIEVSSEVIASSHEGQPVNQTTEPMRKKALATPVARKLARDLGIDINTVQGTGPQGRVMKEDIYRAKEQQMNKKVTLRQAPTRAVEPLTIKDERVERIKISKLRKTIATKMVESKHIIPHTAMMDEFDMTALVEFRAAQKELASAHGVKLTYLPFIVKAVVRAAKDVPIVNSSFDEANEEIILKKYYNVGIAVDTPDGLIVPVIKDADQKSIFEIAKEIERLATASRERTIQLPDLQGGTISITNYGAFGSSYGVPVINYPEAAIIGVGMIEKKPVVVDDAIVIRHMMPVTISFDHRIIDGGDAGRFMLQLKQYLENPTLLLLS